tara:strand:+ start:186 stop:380 length:195 start_codon:yes stop_codon:yes gene_type:complete
MYAWRLVLVDDIKIVGRSVAICGHTDGIGAAKAVAGEKWTCTEYDGGCVGGKSAFYLQASGCDV